MTDNRFKQVRTEAINYFKNLYEVYKSYNNYEVYRSYNNYEGFIAGVKWADNNPEKIDIHAYELIELTSNYDELKIKFSIAEDGLKYIANHGYSDKEYVTEAITNYPSAAEGTLLRIKEWKR